MLVRMQRFPLAAALALALPITFAQIHAQDAPPKGFASIELLWPNGAPGASGKAEKDIPRLFCYPAPGPGPHTAVVVLPGGGYTHVVMEKEGGVEARWLNEHGISAYVLQYRLNPSYMYPSPMQDGERAMRFVRSHATDWGLKPNAVGVWGFSAGGHLAGYLATADPHEFLYQLPNHIGGAWKSPIPDGIDKLSAHPDFAIFG